jgi:nitric oxide reductase NorQ protein
MYLYLAFDAVTATFSPLALMPGTRGRPASNHLKFELGDFDFYFAAIDSNVADKIEKNPADLKANIAAKTVDTINPAEPVMPNTLIDALATGLIQMLKDLPSTYMSGIAPADKMMVDAARKGLEDAMVSENRAEILEIIKRNRRMLNGVLAFKSDGIGWWRDSAGSTGTEFTPKTPEETLDEKAEKAEQMEATTVSFGFGKMAADSPETSSVNETDREIVSATGVFLPTPDDTYIINDQVAHLFKILQISRRNCPQNVRLLGPHGCGKTELAIQFAARLKMPLLIMDCANLREARDWFGYKGAKDGTVYWHESQFVRAVTAGNHVILLDELNRANPHLLNTLMPLLDARRFTYLEEKGDKICVGPGTVFFASMNEGAGYTGTSSLDRAIRDRFPRVVEMAYLGEQDEINLLMRRVGVNEDTATRLVGMANKIRQDATGLAATLTESLSTRQLIAAAQDFVIGGVDTLTFTISNHFSPDGDDDSERVRVQNIIQGKFGDLLAAKAAATGT